MGSDGSSPPGRRHILRGFLAAWLAALSGPSAFGAETAPENLADLSLEELGEIRVTSVSKRPERLLDAPGSIYVITGDDIRRSSATTLPEALRLAPNLEVARVSASQYAISARGFNNAGNKLLVLIDGRIVYTPLYSGVLWYEQDVVLEDVDRIEVISGPGGTLWGSNAVNGVINVITRAAQDTRGGLVSAVGGDLGRGGAVRYGGSLDSGGSYRVYAKGFDIANSARANGTEAHDRWERALAGFRADWGASPEQGFTLQGDAYQGRLDLTVPDDQKISGANLLARWTHQFPGGDHIRLQGYLDQRELEIPGAAAVGTLIERLNIADIELQHRIQRIQGHALTWGGGYRTARDHVNNVTTLAFLPARRDLDWSSLFLQDEIALRDDLNFTAGVKGEHNPYTGSEFLPSLRLAWKPAPQRLVWGALSRAVRTPSRVDRDLYSPAAPPFVFAGGPGFRSETSDVAELGYRAQPRPGLSYSLTAFHHIYDHLRSIEAAGGQRTVGNEMEGESTGIEAWASWQATGIWRLSAGGTMLHQELRLKPGSTDSTGVSAAGNDPDYQWNLRSSLDLPRRMEFDVDIRHVAELPNPVVPAYTAVDLRLGWQAGKTVELSILVVNLFDPRHPEFGAPATRNELERGAYARVIWKI